MTNKEFEALMSMPKHISDKTVILPKQGESIKAINVASDISMDTFLIDVDRHSTICLSRKKLQERHVNSSERLVRLEMDSRPHTNPDGVKLSGNHIHIFREGFGLSYAYELKDFEDGKFLHTGSFAELFRKFCQYCSINANNIDIQDVI